MFLVVGLLVGLLYNNRYLLIALWREYNHYESKNLPQSIAEKNKIYNIIKNNPGNAYGLDISDYQGTIIWDSVSTIQETVPIDFVFVRASMGSNKKDKKFQKNWKALGKKNIIRGAYHYYNPNQNSTKQATNFINQVQLQSGDLPPVIDIEKKSNTQSIEELKKGVLNWIAIVEDHYQVKPILYSYDSFLIEYFTPEELEHFTVWVANYNPIDQPLHEDWSIWQFSEKGLVKGIYENYVDLNICNGSKNVIQSLTID